MKKKQNRAKIKRRADHPGQSSHKLTDYSRHVAVVGLGNAGKSVFLTSLIDNIRYPTGEGSIAKGLQLRDKKWPIRKKQHTGVRIDRFTPLTPHTNNFKPFPYEKYRERLAYKAEWPEKTGDLYSYRFSFHRSDWRRRITLEFIDFPGERLADAAMIEHGYEGWSRVVIDGFSCRFDHDCEVETYKRTIEQEGLRLADAVAAYKKLLSSMYDRYRSWISPSVFRISTDGKMPDCGIPEWWMKRNTGMDNERDFAPLTVEAIAKNPDLTEQFALFYEDYRREVVEPVFMAFRRCHSLVLLVDIPGMLCENGQAYNDALRVYENVLNVCSPGHNLLQKTGSLLLPDAWRPRGISHIALVATKADMVKVEQVGRLRKLLAEMTNDSVNNYHSVPVRMFTCSALQCAISQENDQLAGHLFCNADGTRNAPPQYGDDLDVYDVDDLPEEWPHDWRPGEYCFPELYPRVPRRQNKPPRQEGLGPILQYILDGQKGGAQ